MSTRKPTHAQLRYLRQLAHETQQTYTEPNTVREASNEIKRMTATRERQASRRSRESVSEFDSHDAGFRERDELAREAAQTGGTATAFRYEETVRHDDGASWERRGFGDYEPEHAEITEQQKKYLEHLCRENGIEYVSPENRKQAGEMIDRLVVSAQGAQFAATLHQLPEAGRDEIFSKLKPIEADVLRERFLAGSSIAETAKSLRRSQRDIGMHEAIAVHKVKRLLGHGLVREARRDQISQANAALANAARQPRV